MDKLIELLNEYRTEKGERNLNEFEVSQTLDSLNYLMLFIKRLVDNDKIDKKKIDTRLVRYVESHYDEEGYWVENSYEDYELYECLLMLLAISDTPIKDLISYLK